MTDKEKLEKIKVLADAMYNRMQNLTTDTSGICKAMYDYHQFIINEYYKEEPVSNDLEEATRRIATRHSHITGDTYYANDAWFFKKGAKWQKQQLIDKACNYLFSHIGLFVRFFDDDIVEDIERSDFIKKFRKAMEDEK